MSNELEETIRSLQEQIVKLETENRVYLDFISIVPDIADGIVRSLTSNNTQEAIQRAEILRNRAINAPIRAKGGTGLLPE